MYVGLFRVLFFVVMIRQLSESVQVCEGCHFCLARVVSRFPRSEEVTFLSMVPSVLAVGFIVPFSLSEDWQLSVFRQFLWLPYGPGHGPPSHVSLFLWFLVITSWQPSSSSFEESGSRVFEYHFTVKLRECILVHFRCYSVEFQGFQVQVVLGCIEYVVVWCMLVAAFKFRAPYCILFTVPEFTRSYAFTLLFDSVSSVLFFSSFMTHSAIC